MSEKLKQKPKGAKVYAGRSKGRDEKMARMDPRVDVIESLQHTKSETES